MDLSGDLRPNILDVSVEEISTCVKQNPVLVDIYYHFYFQHYAKSPPIFMAARQMIVSTFYPKHVYQSLVSSVASDNTTRQASVLSYAIRSQARMLIHMNENMTTFFLLLIF